MKITFILFLLLVSFCSFSQKTLQLFGGRNHDVYLGCLNCSNVESNSIWNEVGTYGSQVSSLSIWNEVNEYGSEVGSYSPWNEVASYPPAIVDKEGNFYGYLTVNEVHEKRADFSLALTLYKYHGQIKDNVGEWYNKIFR